MTPPPSAEWSLTAHWVLPIDRPPLERGCVVIDGEHIVAVEPHGQRTPDLDLGAVAILPGLVNAHTHLDLSGIRGLAPPTSDFTGWLRQVIAHRRSRAPEQIQADIEQGLGECYRHGTLLVGDISGDGGSWPVLARSSLRAVVFREMLGLPAERASRAWADADAWLAAHPALVTCRPGLSPHAPYSVRASLFFAAACSAVPVTVHLAETAAERELLGDHRGPFVEFLRDLDVWDPEGLVDRVEDVLRLCANSSPTLFVHGNFLDPEGFFPSNGSLVYCPRTHAAFGHPPHPFRDFLKRGVRVALGTDSLASNPDLSVLAEARFVHRLYPDLPGEVVLRMATLSGAEALGWADETGSLTPGKSADLVAVPLADEADPYQAILAGDAPVRAVLCRGRWLKARI